MKKTMSIALVSGHNSHLDKDAVGQYTEILYQTINKISPNYQELQVELITSRPKSSAYWISEMTRLFAHYDTLHFQYPCEGWGNSIMPGIIPALCKLVKNKTKLVVTFHEWSSMHFLRKLSILPLAYMADALVFVSHTEKKYFTEEIIYKIRKNRPLIYTIPIGINLNVPKVTEANIKKWRDEYLNWNNIKADCLIGYFGFIYKWKQPKKMIKSIYELHQAGIKARLIMAGDFPIDHKSEKSDFLKLIEQMNLKEYVILLGYIENELILANTMSLCNANMLLFQDGLSARRSSFWYLAELGVPIITTYPHDDKEFVGIYEDIYNNENIKFVHADCSAQELAICLAKYKEFKLPKRMNNISPSWTQISEQHLELYKTCK